MSAIGDSSKIIQQCCYAEVSKTVGLEHASEALKKENINSEGVTVKTGNVAIQALKSDYQGEAKELGKSLGKVLASVKLLTEETSTIPDTKGLNELEMGIYTAMTSILISGRNEDRKRFVQDFQNFVDSFNSGVVELDAKSSTKEVERLSEPPRDLNMSLYKKGLRFMADKDMGDKRSELFHKGGALRLRFDERIDRLTDGKDQLPHFKKELSSVEETQFKTLLASMGKSLTSEDIATLKQAFIDYPQIREDTVMFPGELFRTPSTATGYRETTLDPRRLGQVTLLSEKNRARGLGDILQIGEIFCTDRNSPLINIIPLGAERLLKHEVLMHLMLDRAVRDDDIKPLQEKVLMKILEVDTTLLKDVEGVRTSTEEKIKVALKEASFDSVDKFESFCMQQLGIGKEELGEVLQGLDKEKFIHDFKGEDETAQKLGDALAMRLADCAARNEMRARVDNIFDTPEINKISGLPAPVPTVPVEDRIVFTINGGAASGKSTATRKMLGEESETSTSGMPDRQHIVTITRDSLMTSLLEPDSLEERDLDYFAAFAYDEARLIANYADNTRKAREKVTGKGPHLFYDQVMPETGRYDVGLTSSKMDGALVNMPVEISVLLAQLRGEKERRYAGRWCVLNSHKVQVAEQRKVVEFVQKAAGSQSVAHITSTIGTKVGKDFDLYPTVNFDFKENTLDVNSSGYFFDFLRKENINLDAQTLEDLYLPEMSDAKYAELFMSFAKHFDVVKMKILKPDLTEEEITVKKEKYANFQSDLSTKGGELSASVQRSRQARVKSLTNAQTYLRMAIDAGTTNPTQAKSLLDKAEKEVQTYYKDYGKEASSSDVTANAGIKLAEGILRDIRETRSSLTTL